MKVGVVLAAAGRGARAGGLEKKQFALLAGVPLLLRALRPFAGLPAVARVAVVLPEEDLERGAALLAAAVLPGPPPVVVAGGSTRQESVRIGLRALSGLDLVLIHDAARPLASRDLALRTIAAAGGGEGAVPAVPVSDTLKRLEAGRVVTVPRASLYTVQTPQGFPLAMIAEAHARALADGLVATDDGALCERFGYPVRLIEGEPGNVKVTTPADWEVATALLEARERAPGESPRAAVVRTGIGFDVHRLEAGRACVLGGVRIDSAKGPAGYSDADVLVHAVMDAVLGAAGEPDIGQRFPPDDPRYAGADSLGLLAQVREVVSARFEILFVDSVLVAEAPRVAPHAPEMRRRIAGALGLPPERVNVKATTAEGLGALGRGEGIAAQAVATLRARS